MKLLTPQQLEAHDRATLRGMTEGALGSAAVAVPAFYVLHRRWPYYRALTPALKALGLIVVVAPALVIQGERRGLEYDMSQWTGVAQRELQREERAEEERWRGMGVAQRAREWAAGHQFSMLFGGWAVTMAAAGTVLARDHLHSTGQKVVQARMWAQGATIGMIIVAGILTQSRRAEAAKHRGEDHSWAALLEEQKREEDEARRLQTQGLTAQRAA